MWHYRKSVAVMTFSTPLQFVNPLKLSFMNKITFKSCIDAIHQLRNSFEVENTYSRGVYDGLKWAEVLLKLKGGVYDDK